MFEVFYNWFSRAGAGPDTATTMAHIAGVATALVLSILIYIVVKRYIFNTISRYIKETGTTRDDYLVENKVFSRLALIVPAVVFYLLIPTIFTGQEDLIVGARQIMAVYAVIIGVIVAEAILDTVLDVYYTFDASRAVPLKGLIQAIKILLFLFGGLLIISLSVGRSPLYILGGVGAFTAVLMLIFQDSILGLVAGVQLSTNQMLARGDFIEMPGYDADGIVTDVALTTVKVQNSDMSITTIPTHALIKESFRNWRGLDMAAGRRLKRNVNIDITTIRICDEEMLRRYAAIPHVTEYLQQETGILTGDPEAPVDLTLLAERRAVTNVSAFRAYVERFLSHHPDLNHEMTLLVRPLEPTASGLPIQVYVFTKEKSWIPYERIQAGIFEHIMAIVQDFDLKIFQNPSGHDMRAFAAHGG